MLFINSWLPIDNVISPTEFHLHTPICYVIYLMGISSVLWELQTWQLRTCEEDSKLPMPK